MTNFEAVKELRQRLGLTQQEFAQRAGLAVHTVSVYETGKTRTSEGVLFRFAKIAIEHGHKDLADFLTPGQSVEEIIEVNEITELFQQVEEAQQMLAQAQDKLKEATDRLRQRMNERARALRDPDAKGLQGVVLLSKNSSDPLPTVTLRKKK
jgi:transcriptional regulator with XRE-family HTH domain